MTGGDGADVFVLSFGRDHILDFEIGVDRIDVGSPDAAIQYTSFEQIRPAYADNPYNYFYLELGNGTTLIVDGVWKDEVTEDFFIF